MTRALFVSHAPVPLAGPGGAAPVLMSHAVHQNTSVCKRGILPNVRFIVHWQMSHDLLSSARAVAIRLQVIANNYEAALSSVWI